MVVPLPNNTTDAEFIKAEGPHPIFSLSVSRTIDCRLPIEVWHKICSYLYPSQLSRLSLVSKTLAETIASLRYWSLLFHRSHDPKTALWLLAGVPESKCYMMYMCAWSSMICEGCYKKCDINSKNQASFPLPVNPTTESMTRGEITFVGCPVDEQWSIQLCLQCRKDHFALHSETVPHAAERDYLEWHEVTRSYHLENATGLTARQSNRGALGTVQKYLEADTLRRARIVHGGDVGIKAKNGYADSRIDRTHARVHGYSLQ